MRLTPEDEAELFDMAVGALGFDPRVHCHNPLGGYVGAYGAGEAGSSDAQPAGPQAQPGVHAAGSTAADGGAAGDAPVDKDEAAIELLLQHAQKMVSPAALLP